MAALAVGLVVLGSPATELAAHVAASWAPFRDAGAGLDRVPPVPQVPQAAAPNGGVFDPEPHVDVPGVAVPVPRGIDVEIVPPMVPRGVIPEFTPPPAPCGGYSSPRTIPPAVTPGPGSATLSWMADGSTAVRGYRVQAVDQALVSGPQPTPPQQLVAQRADCGEVSTTMTGLTPGGTYVFWLEEQVWDETAQVVEFVHVGSSAPVRIG
ncbi:hypothetical protein [Blastococcus sp. SYSU D00695]